MSVNARPVSLWAMLNHYGPTDRRRADDGRERSEPARSTSASCTPRFPTPHGSGSSTGPATRSTCGSASRPSPASARGGDGSLYVSELFGGVCGFDQIPDCFPGRVVKVAPDGTRTHVNVPFPAGIVVHAGHVYVNAFSDLPRHRLRRQPGLEWSALADLHLTAAPPEMTRQKAAPYPVTRVRRRCSSGDRIADDSERTRQAARHRARISAHVSRHAEVNPVRWRYNLRSVAPGPPTVDPGAPDPGSLDPIRSRRRVTP